MKKAIELIADTAGPLIALAAATVFAHLAFAQSPATPTQPAPSGKSAAPASAAAQFPTQPPSQTTRQTPAGPSLADESAKSDAKEAATTPVKKVDLNNASLAELKTLPLVSDEYAKKIIAHRPYMAKGELVTKAGLPEGVYVAVKRKVVLKAPKKSAPSQSAPKS